MLEKHVESARLQTEKQKKLQKQVRHNVAAKEKETMSDAALARDRDYDGDFSAHEYSMMRRRLGRLTKAVQLRPHSLIRVTR